MSMEWLVLSGLLGLVLGSFCNVVIARMPRIIEQDFAREVTAYLASQGHASPLAPVEKPLSLSLPRSHCPQCEHTLRWFELVPVMSWLIQRGQCRHCQAPIAWRYPVVELLVAVIFMASYSRYGISPAALLCAGFFTVLLVAAIVDWHSHWLPDVFTLPLLWVGILAATFNVSPLNLGLPHAVLGCAMGYGLFASLAWTFQRITGRDGLGGGDTKLLAALGAWLGPWVLPHLLLIASMAGLATALWSRWVKQQEGEFAFGPALALSGALLFYLHASHSLSLPF